MQFRIVLFPTRNRDEKVLKDSGVTEVKIDKISKHERIAFSLHWLQFPHNIL